MHYLYILYSASSDKYYIGQTPDLETRLLFHNELSEDSYTSKYRPWELVCSIAVPSRSGAMKLERYVKGRKSRAYTESLVNDEKARRRLLSRFGVK